MREEMSNVDVSQFKVEPARPPVEPCNRERNSCRDETLELVPAVADARNTAFLLNRTEWRDCLEVARAGAYVPNGFCGLTRGEVKWFVRALRTAVQDGRVTDPGLRDLVLRLVEFCEGRAGADGFTVEIRLKRANPRLDREPAPVKRLRDSKTVRDTIHRRVGACTFMPRPEEPSH